MLKILRNKKNAKKIWIGLAIIIIPAFAFWGFGGISRSREDSRPIGKIFGKNISNLQFKEAIAAVRTSAIMQFGDNLAEVEKYLNFEGQAWQRLILLQETKNRKIKISDREVIETIEETPYFKNRSGFNNKIYTDTLRYVLRVQPRVFEEQTRQNLAIAKLYKQVTGAVKLDDAQIRESYLKDNQELSILYIASPITAPAKEAKAGEKELKEYYSQNKFMFKEPPKINLEYITTDSIIQAKKILSLLEKKSNLENIAKEAGLAKKETGLFIQSNFIPELDLAPDIISQVLNLKPGVCSQLIQSGKFYYLFSPKEKRDTRIPELNEIRLQVENFLMKDKAKAGAQEKINQCAEKLKTLDFNKAARACGLKVASTALFKYNGQIEKLGAADIFWENAKKLAANQASPVISNAKGFYIIKLKSIKPIDEAKFSKEKKEFADKLLAQKKNETFNKFFDELKKKAQ